MTGKKDLGHSLLDSKALVLKSVVPRQVELACYKGKFLSPMPDPLNAKLEGPSKLLQQVL